ncbi:MAG: flavodoxin domain-containing protein, partial [Eubacterium aggregans]
LGEALILCDLNKDPVDLLGYDGYLIGGSIRMGQYPRKLKKLLKKQKDQIRTKPAIFFVNCGFSENMRDYIKNNIHADLVEHASECYCFGGRLNLASLTGTDRMVATVLTRQSNGSGRPAVALKMNQIEACIQKLKAWAEGE